MRNIQKNKIAAILTPVVVLLAIVSIVLLASNRATLSLNGFSVDSSGRIYVGRLYSIEVYQNNQKVYEFDIPHYRNWSFYLKQDDAILIANGTAIYALDQNGSVSYEQEDTAGSIYRQLRQQRETIGNDGNRYTLRYLPFRTSIVNASGEVEYQIPLIDVLAKISVYVSIIGILCIVPLLKPVIEKQLNQKKTDDSFPS